LAAVVRPRIEPPPPTVHRPRPSPRIEFACGRARPARCSRPQPAPRVGASRRLLLLLLGWSSTPVPLPPLLPSDPVRVRARPSGALIVGASLREVLQRQCLGCRGRSIAARISFVHSIWTVPRMCLTQHDGSVSVVPQMLPTQQCCSGFVRPLVLDCPSEVPNAACLLGFDCPSDVAYAAMLLGFRSPPRFRLSLGCA
jgi:hypothetical protein